MITEEILKELSDFNNDESLFSEWLEQVKSGDLQPSNRPGRKFISDRACRGKNVTITPSEMDWLLNKWREKAVSDGVLVFNPLAGNGKGIAKYILI